MADQTVEEESLISQDDIDKLLDASSIEEAEEKLDTPAEAVDLSMDDVGELSQDDIDSLLGGGADEDDAGELSQDDIDSLMGGPAEDEEAGELSQDDIDSLMGGGDDEGDEDMELISQDDIDRLMNPSDDGDTPEDEGDDDDDELISMDDIQGVLEETDVPLAAEATEAADMPDAPAPEPEPEPEAPSAAASDDPLDIPIDAGEAVAVDNCLLTQETMDELIRNAAVAEPVSVPETAEEPDREPDLEDALEDPLDLGQDEDPLDMDLGGEPGAETPDLAEAEAKDELDALLDADDGDLDLDLGQEPEGDVTQEDIDALLQESDDDDSFLDDDEDILISQDDIDTLLMAADQEDEDVLGDLLGDSVDGSMDDFDEQEIMDSSEATEDDTDQVVLEGDDEAEVVAEGVKEKAPIKLPAFLKSKLVLAAASVLLVLGISIPAAYFLFFSGEPVVLPEKESVPVALEETGREVEVASVTIEEPVVATRQSGTIVLADFVILASDLAKDMTYVYADISIDYSDQRAYHEISNNLSFYRDLIYEAIQTHLLSEKRNEVTQADLLWGVENSLKKVLPPHFIEKISFKTFRTS